MFATLNTRACLAATLRSVKLLRLGDSKPTHARTATSFPYFQPGKPENLDLCLYVRITPTYVRYNRRVRARARDKTSANF